MRLTSLRNDSLFFPFGYSEYVLIRTNGTLEFIDLTDRITRIVETSNVQTGLVNIQSLHTTVAILVNENEPLLLEDMRRRLEAFAPRDAAYHHDDFSLRIVNRTPDEEPNGHAHCKAMILPSSVTLQIQRGQLRLGCWQRIFMAELDRAKERTISVMVLG